MSWLIWALALAGALALIVRMTTDWIGFMFEVYLQREVLLWMSWTHSIAKGLVIIFWGLGGVLFIAVNHP